MLVECRSSDARLSHEVGDAGCLLPALKHKPDKRPRPLQARFALANRFDVAQIVGMNSIVEDLVVDHRSVAIIPSSNLDASEAFYRRLGFDVVSDYGHYRILADGRGWHLHLTHAPGWPKNIEDNPFGLYLYVDDVDAVAEQVSDLIIEKGAPHAKCWGTYEFAVSDPSGLLVRIGRLIDQG